MEMAVGVADTARGERSLLHFDSARAEPAGLRRRRPGRGVESSRMRRCATPKSRGRRAGLHSRKESVCRNR
jgi:hypothetical protein